jgi:hypothetical protein
MYERIYLSFIQLVQFSDELRKNDERLQGVVELYDTPKEKNLSERLKECLQNFSKRFQGKRDFHLDEYDLDLRTMPSEVDIKDWLIRCLTTAYPLSGHQSEIAAFVEKQMTPGSIQQETVNDYVSEAYLNYNLPLKLDECMEKYARGLTEMPSWDVAKSVVKDCLLLSFSKDEEYQIKAYVESRKDDIMHFISEEYFRHNVMNSMDSCMEQIKTRLNEKPRWKVAKNLLKECLLRFFPRDTENINQFLSFNKDRIMDDIQRFYLRGKRSRKEEDEEEKEEKEEEEENVFFKKAKEAGKMRSKKIQRQTLHPSARKTKRNKKQNKRTGHKSRKSVRGKVLRKRHTRR